MTLYTNCNSCGVPILQRTFDRTGGYCKNCGEIKNSPPRPPREYSPERFDPLETDPNHEVTMRIAHSLAIDAAERETQTKFPYLEFTRDDYAIGFCHVIWRHKKRILQEEFGLEWQSPAELNPDTFYD